MAEVVAKALGSGGHVAVTAGTGTGKSLAYLVPAVRFPQARRGRDGDQGLCRTNSRTMISRSWLAALVAP